jgi:hypothetical protein
MWAFTGAAKLHVSQNRPLKERTVWRGVSVDMLLGQAGYDAPYVMAFCDGGYTTNVRTCTSGRAQSGSAAWT